MKVSIPLVTFLASSVSALSLGNLLFESQELITPPNAQAEVPGDSPIETCLDEEPQLVDIEEVNISPNPPIPGTNLTISARGTLKTDLVDGSYVDVLVRYGFIVLVNKRYDLCELLPEVELECPVKAGYLRLERTVELPEEVPPGFYTVEAKAYTPEEELLTCLQAEVSIDN